MVLCSELWVYHGISESMTRSSLSGQSVTRPPVLQLLQTADVLLAAYHDIPQLLWRLKYHFQQFRLSRFSIAVTIAGMGFRMTLNSEKSGEVQ